MTWRGGGQVLSSLEYFLEQSELIMSANASGGEEVPMCPELHRACLCACLSARAWLGTNPGLSE